MMLCRVWHIDKLSPLETDIATLWFLSGTAYSEGNNSQTSSKVNRFGNEIVSKNLASSFKLL